MEAQLFAKYFTKFLKGFDPVQFTESWAKGEFKLTNLDLNEEFIQRLFLIPPKTEIRSSQCNELTITIPENRNEPITLNLDKVQLSLEEPEQIRPIFKSKPDQAPVDPITKILDKAIQNMRVIVNQVQVSIKFLPRNDPNEAPWTPHLRWEIRNLEIFSTDSQRKPVSLDQAIQKSPDSPLETTYKTGKCQALSIFIVGPESEIPVLKEVPVEIQVETQSNTENNQVVAIALNWIVDEIQFVWNTISWGLVVRLFSSLRTCLEREIPEEFRQEHQDAFASRQQKINKKLLHIDMKYQLFVRKWSLKLVRGEDLESKEGYILEGEKFTATVSPQRKVTNNEGESLFESTLDVTVQSFTFGEISPNPLIDPRVARAISQVNSSDDLEFLRVKINHQWATLAQPKETVLSVTLNGLQVVFDRGFFEGLYRFGFSSSVIEVIKRDISKAKGKLEKIKEQRGKIDEQVSNLVTKLKLSKWELATYFNWFKSSKVNVEITNTVVIIPKDYFVREDGIQLQKELRSQAKRISFTNDLQWELVPYLKDSLSFLEKSDFISHATDTTHPATRFQWEITDVSVETLDPDVPDSREVVLQPSSMRAYGRLLKESPDVLIQPKMELAIHSDNFQLTITHEQEAYFKQMLPWHRKMAATIRQEFGNHLSETLKSDLKESLEEGKKTALKVASKLVENTKAADFIENAKANTARAVEQAMKSFQFAVVFKAERGNILVPLYHAEQPKESDQPLVNPPLASFNFSGLDLIFENSVNHYTIQLQLSKLEANELDHPKSPSSWSFVPLEEGNYANQLGEQDRHFVLRCHRERPLEGHPFTRIVLNLQAMRIMSQTKQNAIRNFTRDIEGAIPTLKQLSKRISNTLLGISEKPSEELVQKVQNAVSKGVNIAEKTFDFLELTWAIQVADCELVLVDSDWRHDSGVKPFGSIKISNFNKDSVDDRLVSLQQQLAATKNQLGDLNGQLGTVQEGKLRLQEQSSMLKNKMLEDSKKFADELSAMEQQLVLAKMSLVDAQIEAESLKHQRK